MTLDLLLTWTARAIRARYQQSFLGGLWAVLQPAAIAAILSIVFTQFLPIDTGEIPYPVFAYAGMVPWALFTTSVTDMVDSLVVNMNLVTKIYFRREILPMGALLARLVDFLIAMTLLLVLIPLFGLPLRFDALVYLPLPLAVQLAFALGLGLAGAALNVFYRDVKHLFLLLLQVTFYATPVIYPLSMVPAALRPIYLLNPMVGVIRGYHAILLHAEPPDGSLAVAAVVAAVTLVGGYVLFKRTEPQFADVV
jgi:lipopolysaccharide transport system permease protein